MHAWPHITRRVLHEHAQVRHYLVVEGAGGEAKRDIRALSDRCAVRLAIGSCLGYSLGLGLGHGSPHG